jgi:hypothetical protein
MLISTSPVDVSTSGTDSGLPRAVCYRVALQDPLETGGGNLVYGLYRTAASPADTFSVAMDAVDLFDDFWQTRTISEPPIGDYLAGNIVGLEFGLLSSGTGLPLNSASGAPSKPFRWSGTGVTVSGAAVTGAEAVEIRVTSLSERGARLVRGGGMPLSRAIELHGKVTTRRVPIRYLP